MEDAIFSAAVLFLKDIARTPYDFSHPLETVNIASKYLCYVPADKMQTVLTACVLHDVIEDFPVHYSDLQTRFGKDVADLVYDVTDELGHNRQERNVRTQPKILANRLACFVKFCDRYANWQNAITNNVTSMQTMYQKEYPDFRAALLDSLPQQMWFDMDRLMAFAPGR